MHSHMCTYTHMPHIHIVVVDMLTLTYTHTQATHTHIHSLTLAHTHAYHHHHLFNPSLPPLDDSKHQLYETVTLGAANNCQGETNVAMGVATVPTGVANVTVGVANVNMGVTSVPGVVPKELKRSSSHTSVSRESSLCESGESNAMSLEGMWVWWGGELGMQVRTCAF